MDSVQSDIRRVTGKRELFAPLENATVLVTGATGLIGSMLVRILDAANDLYASRIRIVGQVRDRGKTERLFGERRDKIQWTETYDAPCDFIVHTVSPTASKFFVEHPVETVRTSVLSAMSVLETARKNGASAVYLSSMEQYGTPYGSERNMTEDRIGVIDHLNVRSCYPESKRLCECLCASYAAEYGLNVKIARLAQTFGAGAPPSDNRMPMQFARAAAAGRDIVLHTEGKSVSNFVYLTDALTGILTVLERGKPGEAYNVCNDAETRTVREVAELVRREVAHNQIRVRVEKKENMGYAPDATLRLDSSKLRGLGWTAEVGLAEAYAKLVEYVRGSAT